VPATARKLRLLQQTITTAYSSAVVDLEHALSKGLANTMRLRMTRKQWKPRHWR